MGADRQTETMAGGAGDVVALTQALVRVPSVNPRDGGDGEGELARLVAAWLEAWGYGVELQPVAAGRSNVVARAGAEAGRRVVLNGHLDTVGVEGMVVAPFGGELRGGRVWGRGAVDMKAGLAVLLATARELAPGLRSGALPGELVVALVVDEEDESRGMKALLSGGLAADAAIVCEPTGLDVVCAHKGFAWVEVVFEGRAAHGALPELGVDAIRHAGLLLTRLVLIEAALATAPAHPLLGRGSVHAGTIQGGTAPNVYPGACRVLLERRLLPGEDGATALVEVERLLGWLRSEEPRLRATARLVASERGTEVPAGHPLVEALRSAGREAGLSPQARGLPGWVETGLLNETGIPAVCFGPGELAAAHTADESVEVAQLEPARAALVNAVAGLLRG